MKYYYVVFQRSTETLVRYVEVDKDKAVPVWIEAIKKKYDSPSGFVVLNFIEITKYDFDEACRINEPK